MDDALAAAYLDRIGARWPAVPTAAALRDLMTAHLVAVPFENLSIHLGETIVLDEDALLDKVVRRRRGGFCYELNGAFALLLSHLGFAVDLLAARVHGDGGFGAPFAHLTLRVHVDGVPWLADVGFGRFALAPARFDVRGPQADAGGEILVSEAPGGDLDVAQGGAPQLRVEQRARALADFEPTCWYQQTSPDSHFTSGPTCSCPTSDGGRVTLADDLLITTSPIGERTEQKLAHDEIVAAYERHFGIVLERRPAPARSQGTAG